MVSLSDSITKAIDQARKAENGRHAELLVNDGPLRQTVIALKQGVRLAEHNSPPAASIQVARGVVKVDGEEPAVLETGDVAALTHQRHAVEALDDSVFLLTTVTSVPGSESHGGHVVTTGEVPRVRAEELTEAEQAAAWRESDQQTGGGRIDD